MRSHAYFEEFAQSGSLSPALRVRPGELEQGPDLGVLRRWIMAGGTERYHDRLKEQAKRIRRLSEEHAVSCGMTPGRLFLELSTSLSRVNKALGDCEPGEFTTAFLVDAHRTLQRLKATRLQQPTPPPPPIIISGDFRSVDEVEQEIRRRLQEVRQRREETRTRYARVLGLRENAPAELFNARGRELMGRRFPAL